MMTLYQFLKEALLVPSREPRRGQHFSNMLYLHRPDLAAIMFTSGLDPYYRDELIWPAIEFLKENWSKPVQDHA